MSGAFVLSVVFFYVTRWVISRIISINAPSIEIPFGSGSSVNILDPRTLPLLLILLVIVYVGSSAVIAAVSLSGLILLAGLKRLYEFGPEGLERVQKVVLRMTALIASIVALWAAFG